MVTLSYIKLLEDKTMKYSMEEYRKELDKAHEITCLRDAIDEIMAPYREKLYQGLEIGDGVTVHLWSDATRRYNHPPHQVHPVDP